MNQKDKIKLNTENKNLREMCYYYPCHQGISKEEYDCRQCYCSLYEECSTNNNTLFGGYWLEKNDIRVFACENCNVVHRKKYVGFILNMKKEGKSSSEILEFLKRMYTNK